MRRRISGDVFIIPNEVTKLTSFPEDSRRMLTLRLKELAGLDIAADDELVQVWITTKECDNLSCTHGGLQRSLGEEEKDWDGAFGYYPSYLPKKILSEKKEGDVLMLSIPRYESEIELTCNQLGYRYSRFGRFEEVLSLIS